MKYCIDTSALMDAWCRWYPPNLFPSLWEQIDSLIATHDLVSSQEVLRELERKKDDLFQWAKERAEVFLPLSDEVQGAAIAVLEQFRHLVDGRTGKSFADPFVIATAQTTSTILVTGEKPTGSPTRPKIPDVCAHLDIPWISMVEMICEEGWTF